MYNFCTRPPLFSRYKNSSRYSARRRSQNTCTVRCRRCFGTRENTSGFPPPIISTGSACSRPRSSCGRRTGRSRRSPLPADFTIAPIFPNCSKKIMPNPLWCTAKIILKRHDASVSVQTFREKKQPIFSAAFGIISEILSDGTGFPRRGRPAVPKRCPGSSLPQAPPGRKRRVRARSCR